MLRRILVLPSSLFLVISYFATDFVTDYRRYDLCCFLGREVAKRKT